MIDLTLLPKEWREEWVAIPAMSEGESSWWRRTLRVGDILMRKRDDVRIVRAVGDAVSISVWPRHPHPDLVLVGRDVSIEQLYPQLWTDWVWAE